MKDYFVRLFEYDRYTNQLMMENIIKTNDPQKPLKLMAHLLAAQQIWLKRCEGLSAAGSVLWPDWPADTCMELIKQNNIEWLNYLDKLDATDFEKIISYKNLRGDSYENRLTDILAHVINHGTHHRAQMGHELKAAGLAELPITDYIFYLRN